MSGSRRSPATPPGQDRLGWAEWTLTQVDPALISDHVPGQGSGTQTRPSLSADHHRTPPAPDLIAG